ncbi:uncharacterized protein LOC124955787 [Vespa velutina]|uniref:uncharacterized protein LOC124955787 n=1 Tax=Vespa velutina TaxID=202808 RepID=UPI001FB28FC6|nr:uncharacterized protein LOC124955787 [Vespa velutina]
MSQRRHNTQILLCVFFTGLFLELIELGQGLQCYTCDSEIHNDCANPTSERLKTCNSTNIISYSMTNSVINSMTNSMTDTSIFAANMNDTNSTILCYTGHFGIQNQSEYKEIIVRGCTTFMFYCNDMLCLVPYKIKSCNVELCQSDQCNSSDMVKMGMISLLLPLITILLRIR